MIWIILTFVFGWLLCGAWAMRMMEIDERELIERDAFFWVIYLFGPTILAGVWLEIWPKRLWKFGKDFSKGVVSAFKDAAK